MRPSTAARNAISPLLSQLIRQLNAEGHTTKGAYFTRIQHDLDGADDELALLVPIRALSTSSVVGFELSDDADLLLQRIADKANHIAADLDARDPVRH